MTQLETLIQTLCPNGVKFVKLGEVAEIQYGYPFNASLFTDEKNEKPIIRIRDIVPAKTSTYYLGDVQGLENYIIHKGDILLGMDGYFNMDKWDSEDAYLNQRVCKISAKNSEIVLDGFLFHYLKPQFKKIEQSTAGGSVIHLSAKIISNLQIPLPPLAVQSEIVRILDKFTLYKSELAAELAARLRQYEYYRDQLLTFDDTVKRVKLGEVGFYPTGRIAINEVESYVGVENLLKDRNGVEFLEKTPKMDVAIQFLPNDILIGNIRPYLKKIWMADRKGGTNGDVVTVRIKPEFIDKVNPKYLYHQLASDMFFNYDNINAKGAKMPRGDKNAILQYSIPLPPLSEQEHIVSILDRFDKLCHDIREGLPAEIDLRQKQYEHYRDKLLTFG